MFFSSDDASKQCLRGAERSFNIAWRFLKFEVRCESEPSIFFDATQHIGPPAKLQFALNSPCRRDISIEELKRRKITLNFQKDTLLFTYANKPILWNDENVKLHLISTLNNYILDDIACATIQKDTAEGLAIIENIRITEPAILKEGRIAIFELGDELYIVGSKGDMSKFSRDCLPAEIKPGSGTSEAVPFKVLNVSSDEITGMTELNIFSDIENSFPGITFTLSKEITVNGPQENVYKAVEMFDGYRQSISKRNVIFEDPTWAKIFVNKDGTVNSTLCRIVKGLVLKREELKIQKCHVSVNVKGPPEVMVCCLSQEDAAAAAVIVSKCLHKIDIPNRILEKMKERLDEWRAHKNFYSISQNEKHLIGIITCDLYETYNKCVVDCFLEQSKPASGTTEAVQTVILSNMTPDEIRCLREFADIADILPNLKWSFSNEPKITGTEEDIQKAVEIFDTHGKLVFKKAVTFKDVACANTFINADGMKNEELCEFVKCQVLKNKQNEIHKCHIQVSDGKLPSVTVYCLSPGETDIAAHIVSDCLNTNSLSKLVYDKAKSQLEKMFQRKKLYVLSETDKEVVLATTNDVLCEYQSIIAKHSEKSIEVSIPSSAYAYLTQFGHGHVQTAKNRYNVSVTLKEKCLILTGTDQNIKDAKLFIKNSYVLERFYINTNHTLINKIESELDCAAHKNQCCWTACLEKDYEKGMLENVNYKASWIDHTTGAKLTLIEGCAARIEYDVLLVFVTDTLFPIQAKTQLGDGNYLAT